MTTAGSVTGVGRAVATSVVVGHRPLRLMNRTVSSNRMYIVPPRTIGLTRSPPGVATAAKIAMPRMIIRRDVRSRCRGHDPDPRQAEQQDRELHDQAEHQEQGRHEVEVRPGGGLRRRGTSSVKPNRNCDRERQDDVGDRHAEREEEQGERDPRPDGPPFGGRQAGRDERPELVEQDRHREDDPDDDRDLDLDDERVADPEDLERLVAGSGSIRKLRIGDREVEADDGADGDREDRPEQAGPQLAEMVDERHDRLVAGRGGGGGRGGIGCRRDDR